MNAHIVYRMLNDAQYCSHTVFLFIIRVSMMLLVFHFIFNLNTIYMRKLLLIDQSVLEVYFIYTNLALLQ